MPGYQSPQLYINTAIPIQTPNPSLRPQQINTYLCRNTLDSCVQWPSNQRTKNENLNRLCYASVIYKNVQE